jgi:hypothetical protein
VSGAGTGKDFLLVRTTPAAAPYPERRAPGPVGPIDVYVLHTSSSSSSSSGGGGDESKTSEAANFPTREAAQLAADNLLGPAVWGRLGGRLEVIISLAAGGGFNVRLLVRRRDDHAPDVIDL